MKADKKKTYAYPAEPGQKPDGFGRMHWVMRWWATNLGRSGLDHGWRGQHFCTNMDERVREDRSYNARLRREPTIVVLENEAAFQKLTGKT